MTGSKQRTTDERWAHAPLPMARRSSLCATLLMGVGTLATASSCVEKVPESCPPQLEGERISLLTTKDPEGLDGDVALRFCIDLNAASRRDATATSPGRDESYAMSQPNVVPWTNITYEQAAMACGRAGKTLCPNRLYWLIRPSGNMNWANSEQWISGVPITEDRIVRDQFDDSVGGRPDMGSTVPYPDTQHSLAYWTSERSIVGTIQGDVASGVPSNAYTVDGQGLGVPVHDPGFKHPLLGFRCCVDARLHQVFKPVKESSTRILSEAPDVPLAQ